MNTLDFIKLLRHADPTGTLEVSLSPRAATTSDWQTVESARVLLGDSGARLVLNLKPSPAPPRPLSELPKGALFELAPRERNTLTDGVKVAKLKGGDQRVMWLASGTRESLPGSTLVFQRYLTKRTG